jgi:ABC-2 type transport system permease protein
MTSNFSFYKNVFWQLFRTELIEFKKTFFNRTIDLCIMTFCILVVMGYLFSTQFNMPVNFGVFTLAGTIGAMGLWESYPRAFGIIADLEGPNVISSYLTLPIPSWLVLITKMLYWAFCCTIKSLLVLPIGKLLLWDSLSLASINWFQFLTMLCVTNIFYGIYILFIAAVIPNIEAMESAWTRLNFPLWFLGCSQFSWFTFYTLSPKLAYLDLLNPITYIMEGSRAAMLGQEGSLPFGACVGMLCIFSILFGAIGMTRLKKRLDFV